MEGDRMEEINGYIFRRKRNKKSYHPEMSKFKTLIVADTDEHAWELFCTHTKMRSIADYELEIITKYPSDMSGAIYGVDPTRIMA